MSTVNRTTRMLVGDGVALLGLTVVLISTGFHAQAHARRPSFDTPVSAGALDPANIDANNSPALVEDPRQPSVLAPVRDVLRYGGIALLLAGLAATGSSLVRS